MRARAAARHRATAVVRKRSVCCMIPSSVAAVDVGDVVAVVRARRAAAGLQAGGGLGGVSQTHGVPDLVAGGLLALVLGEVVHVRQVETDLVLVAFPPAVGYARRDGQHALGARVDVLPGARTVLVDPPV